jgi:flavodoxin
MKTLVAYYSRSGNTRKLAQAIAKELGAEIEEITEPRDRAGVFGFLGAGMDATFKRATPILPFKADPSGYDLVVVGAPVWSFTVASPVRTFLEQFGKGLKAVAFFCTVGGSGQARAFREMERLAGKKPSATLAILEKELQGDYGKKVREFADALRKSAAVGGP